MRVVWAGYCFVRSIIYFPSQLFPVFQDDTSYLTRCNFGICSVFAMLGVYNYYCIYSTSTITYSTSVTPVSEVAMSFWASSRMNRFKNRRRMLENDETIEDTLFAARKHFGLCSVVWLCVTMRLFRAIVATPFVAAGSLLLILSLQFGAVESANPFSSNVVALTPKNWKEEVLDSPYGVFVNICRSGWGYCQLLQPVSE